MDEVKPITSSSFYKIFASIFGTILVGIISFFGASIYNNMVTIQKELVDIKMQLAKIETSHYMTKLEVIEVLEKYISKYHDNKPTQ